ncbi:MAG TPA: hypothetical protein VG407_11875 [Caulobacteraceae bacterium]|jgi:hypothetical protein|nr:hypothetical protein [Caulobacteraceae bacterium]
MASRTIYLARLIGLALLITAVAMLANRADAVSAVANLTSDPSFLFTYGLLSLVIGLAMVLAHNVWRGGVLPVAVTVIGWLLTLRGALLLTVPAATVSNWVARMHVADHVGAYLAIVGLIGLLFTIGGFWSERLFPPRGVGHGHGHTTAMR